MCGIGIDLVLTSGSNLTCFFVRGSKSIRFCLRAENYLVLIYGSKSTWFFARGSKLSLFLCAGRKRLACSVGID